MNERIVFSDALGGQPSSPEEALIVAVIKSALEVDGPDFLRCKHGLYWLGMLDIAPTTAWRSAGQDSEWEYLEECEHKEENSD